MIYILYIFYSLKIIHYVLYKLNNYPPCVIDEKNKKMRFFIFFVKTEERIIAG